MRASLTIHVRPRARRTEIVGWHGDAVKMRVAAPPIAGAANEELVRFLADVLGVPPSAVRIAGGHTARRKRVEIDGLVAAAVLERLGLGGGQEGERSAPLP
jgi:hypothetical protein